MIEHYIQRDIIDQLSASHLLRFSQLKPRQLESNLFMYHLKQLIKAGYVEKIDGGYQLGPVGLTYVDTLSLTNRQPRKQPKVISIITLQNNKGEWLLGRRKLQPYLGALMFPCGKQHFGEAPEIHVTRELYEKTGLAVPLVRRGMTDIRIHNKIRVLTHTIGHVYSGTITASFLPQETKQYLYEWRADIPVGGSVPGTKDLAQALREEVKMFFISKDFYIK